MHNWRFLNRGEARRLNFLNRSPSSVSTMMLPGLIAALAIAGLLKLGVLQPLENIAYSQGFQLRGAVPWDDRVVVIAIDNASLKALGRFPWPRHKYTELLKLLTDGAASTVVLDILLTEPSPEDQALAAAMINHGRVVLPRAWDFNGSPLQATPTLRQAALIEGHIHQRPDGDGLVRTLEPQLENVPMLGIATAQVYSLVRDPVEIPDLNQTLWLNWAGSVANIPTYSYADVLKARIAPRVFENKIVIVGVTASGFDALQTPFNRNPSTTNVYLHATATHNILQQNFLHVPSEN
ncbi:MAG: CHASE2 domain-containing protein, partial [Leptolyngbyaceae cyanobacterium CSU_1_4]|nr:CHASE2 domain-containing protein [Leptolyngbyaceae cyanobacterium CSU_1_4]